MHERIHTLLRHPATTPSAIGVLSFAAGVGVGLGVAAWKARKGYSAEEVVSVDQPELDFDVPVEEFQFVNPGWSASAAAAQLERIRAEMDRDERDSGEGSGDPSSDPDAEAPRRVVVGEDHPALAKNQPDEDVAERINIFVTPDEDWNYDKELMKRTVDEPYILHTDEFHNQEMDYHQSVLYWYEGDKTMADDQDMVLYNWPDVVGELRWGHGSNDPNALYVRNERLMLEFEILKDSGKYSDKVFETEAEDRLNDDELSHGVPKFRPDD